MKTGVWGLGLAEVCIPSVLAAARTFTRGNGDQICILKTHCGCRMENGMLGGHEGRLETHEGPLPASRWYMEPRLGLGAGRGRGDCGSRESLEASLSGLPVRWIQGRGDGGHGFGVRA